MKKLVLVSLGLVVFALVVLLRRSALLRISLPMLT